MGRFSVGREVDDFVKTFLAAQKSAQDNSTADARSRYYEALAAKNMRRGDASKWQPFLDKAMKYLEGGSGHSSAAPAGGSAGATASAGGWWTPERQKFAADYLIKNAGLSKYGAAGLVARWAGVESKDKGPTSLNPNGAWGIAQWLSPDRKRGIQGNDSFEDQLRYVVQELNSTEKGAAQVLRNAKSFDDGARGASMYERAENFNPKTGTDDFTAKTPVQSVYASVFGEDGAPAAPTAPKPAKPAPAEKHEDAAPTAASALPIFAQQPSSMSTSAVPAEEPHADLEPELQGEEYTSFAAEGGMIDQPPSAPDVPLEAALDGALRSIQDGYGLNQQAPAIPGADAGYQQRLSAFQSNDRAISPDAMDALIQHAGGADEALRQIYGHYAKAGDMKAASEAAAGVVQAARQRSMELGQRAEEALQQQDFPSAAQALIAAYNDVPDGQKVTGEVNQQGIGKAVVTDRGGKVVEELPLNPQTLAMFAQKFSTGSDYYSHIARFAKPSAPQGQGAVPAYAFGGSVEAPEDDYTSDAMSSLYSDDMAETAADTRAAQLSEEPEPTVQTAQYDGAAPSAVQTESAPGIEQPPYIPLDPDMTPEERRMIDSLNRRMQWTYQQRVQEYRAAERSRSTIENREAVDRRSRESREAADLRNEKTLEQRGQIAKQRSDDAYKLQENSIKARREDKEREKPEYALNQASEEGFRKIRRTDPESDERTEAWASVLDAGAAYAEGRNKDRYGTKHEDNYETDEMGHPGRIGEYKAALDSLLKSAKEDPNAKRADGSPMADVSKANVKQLDEAGRKRFLNLIDGVASRNRVGTSPDVLVGALYTAAFGLGSPMALDRKTGRLVIGEGVDRVSVAVNGDEFRMIAALRKQEQQRLAAAIDQAKAAKAKAVDEKKVATEKAQAQAGRTSMAPPAMTPDEQYAAKYGLTRDARPEEVDAYINRGMR